MKLAYITSANIPDSWAHSIQIMNMCKAFAQNNIDVTLVVPERKIPATKNNPFVYYKMEPLFSVKKIWCLDLFPGNPHKVFYFIRLVSFYFSAKIYSLYHHFDTIYSRDVYASLFFKKVILERHSFSKKTSFLDIFAFRRARALVVLTSFIKQKFVSLGIAEKNIFVAPDGVDEESFSTREPKDLQAFGIQKTDVVCGYIGTLKTMGMEKGVLDCINAIELLPDTYKLLIVGGEPVDIEYYKNIVAQKIKEGKANLSKKVFFVGQVEHTEVPAYAQTCSVLLAPFPENEHYSYFMSPLKIFEYMASKRPIITTNLPSLREVLTDNHNALLVPPSDPQALARAIQKVIENKDVSHALSEQAYADVVLKYTWRQRAKNIIVCI